MGGENHPHGASGADRRGSGIRVRMEAFPDKTEAQLREKYTPGYFAKEEYGDRVAVFLDQFIAQQFKKHLNP